MKADACGNGHLDCGDRFQVQCPGIVRDFASKYGVALQQIEEAIC